MLQHDTLMLMFVAVSLSTPSHGLYLCLASTIEVMTEAVYNGQTAI